MPEKERSICILLVEDNPDDVILTREALKDGKIKNMIFDVGDGAEAMSFLKKKGKYAGAIRPDIIFLDLNLPKKNGRQVLAEIKNDPEISSIPVAILTTSESEEDIIKSYNLHANCYITKPVNLERFMLVINQIDDFWFDIVKVKKG
jgi:two-component system, chemotaxis family, response regulator Rcp1